jgi:two-component system cell cycle response regulator CpdR
MNHSTPSHLSVADELRNMEQEASLRILLAEEDQEMRHLLAHDLRRNGHQVLEARDGGELLKAIETGRRDFDLVICEQSLPGVPGLRALDQFRAHDLTTPFILVTRNVDVAFKARRLGALVSDYPLGVEDIQSAIQLSPDPTQPTYH